VLVIVTTLADAAVPVTLHSCYVGERRNDTHATHLTQLPGEPGGRLETHVHLPDHMPVGADERRGCLYDHLQLLLATLNELGHDPSIDVLDAAVDVVDQ
jgi:hypothetical protein